VGFERTYGAFSCLVALTADIDQNKIMATMGDGVLKVVAPRMAKSEPQQIEGQPSV